MKRKELSRKETWLHIILPVLISVAAAAAIIWALVHFSQNDPSLTQKMADLVIMCLIFTLFLAGLLVIFLLIKAISAVNTGIRKLPAGLDKANSAVDSVNPILDEILDKSLEPIIKSKSWAAGIKGIFTRN